MSSLRKPRIAMLVVLLPAAAAIAIAQSSGAIFSDGFESGDTSAWRVVREQGRGMLDVNRGAALEGRFGLEVSPQGRAFVQTHKPNADTVADIEFFFGNPGDIPLSIRRGKRVEIFRAYGKERKPYLRVLLSRRSPFTFYSRYQVREQQGGYHTVGLAIISRRNPTHFRLVWEAGSPGRAAFWVSGRLAGARNDLDNGSHAIERLRLGAVGGATTPATTGSYYLDDFASFRTLAP